MRAIHNMTALSTLFSCQLSAISVNCRPMTLFYDRATLRDGKARITPEGYFVADALVARANNIQSYKAGELGLTDRDPNETIRVFRPEKEVFAADSLASASRLPITLDHPPVMLDASNYREYSRGESGEEIMRDGEFMRVPIRVTDAAAVRSVQGDRQEFSMGYTAEIVMDGGEFEGQAYDATATNLRYNHLAACRAARGGPELRITDERPAAIGASTMPKIVMVDNAPVDVSNPDAAATVVANLIAARDTANTALDAAQETIEARDATIAERDATIVARDAEIVTLKDAAKLSPKQLRDAAGEYARTRSLCDKLGVQVADDADVPAMHKAVVDTKMGDKAAAYDDDAYKTAFDVLTADSDGDAPVADPLRDGIMDGLPANIADGAKQLQDARNKRFDRFENAHRRTVSAGE